MRGAEVSILMRIAVVSSLFPPFAIGGAEEVASQLACAFRDLGCAVDVISTCRRQDLGPRLFRTDLWNGIRVWRIAPWNLYWRFDRESHTPGRVRRAVWHAVDLYNPTVSPALEAVLKEILPDAVNTHNIDGLSPAVWNVVRGRSKVVVHTVHDYHLLCPRAILRRRDGTRCQGLCRFCRIYASYHRRFQDRISAMVAPSHAAAAIHRLHGWTEPRLEVIENAVYREAFQPAEMGSEEPLRALFLSRLEAEKGCNLLISVMRRFRKADEIEFHIAGRGSYERILAEFAESAPNVMWHGFVSGETKHRLLASADIFLQLSEWPENAPLAMIEAKQYGLYVVGSDVGGIPEQLGDESAGQLIPPGDAEALCNVLQSLSVRRGELRNRRKERASSQSGRTPLTMAEEYLALFQSLLTSLG